MWNDGLYQQDIQWELDAEKAFEIIEQQNNYSIDDYEQNFFEAFNDYFDERQIDN